MKKILTLITVVLSLSVTHAQKAQLIFYGIIEEGMFQDTKDDTKQGKNKPLKDVNVHVYLAGEQISTTTSKETGFYGVLLKAGSTYEVVFEKDGYFSKTYVMNCKNLKHSTDGSALKCPMDIDLFKALENAELQKMTEKPYGMCSVAQNQLKWDVDAMTANRKKFYEIGRPLYLQNNK